MNFKKFNKKSKSTFLFMLTITTIFIVLLQMNFIFPNNLMLLEGEEYTYNISSPIKIDAKVDRSGVLSLNGEVIDDNYTLEINKPLVIKPEQLGNFNIRLKLLGIIPFKSVSINVTPKVSVVPCGNTIGVKLYTDGILVVGTSEFTSIDRNRCVPWKESEIKAGDIISVIEGEKLNGINSLTKIVESSAGKKLNITIIRKDTIINTTIIPQKDIENKKYRLGLWVRDSTSGIGTLTFYEPETRYFGALGHGITDIDTGELLTISKGEILNSNIISVKKGVKGRPGELKGVFIQSGDNLGRILENSEKGIYGQMLKDINYSNISAMPIAIRSQIKEGPAYILSNIQGEKVEKFDIEIQKVMRQNEISGKGMIIKITDKRLLEMTGGIVQGMSGSPIIQNDKIVGAVTHVFVNDPTKGYGIFVEWMLDKVIQTKI